MRVYENLLKPITYKLIKIFRSGEWDRQVAYSAAYTHGASGDDAAQ